MCEGRIRGICKKLGDHAPACDGGGKGLKLCGFVTLMAQLGIEQTLNTQDTGNMGCGWQGGVAFRTFIIQSRMCSSKT